MAATEDNGNKSFSNLVRADSDNYGILATTAINGGTKRDSQPFADNADLEVF